uniref:Uncharacterized protein n=1 Tax=Kalanchoe fedtschenkoi TaxID=63787 RepID=A0A7N0V0W7_KALFE
MPNSVRRAVTSRNSSPLRSTTSSCNSNSCSLLPTALYELVNCTRRRCNEHQKGLVCKTGLQIHQQTQHTERDSVTLVFLESTIMKSTSGYINTCEDEDCGIERDGREPLRLQIRFQPQNVAFQTTNSKPDVETVDGCAGDNSNALATLRIDASANQIARRLSSEFADSLLRAASGGERERERVSNEQDETRRETDNTFLTVAENIDVA